MHKPSGNHEVITAPVSEIRDHLTASRLLATIAVTASMLASSETAHAKELPVPKGGPEGQVGMSDEFTETRWAYATDNTPVRKWPSENSKPKSILRLMAPDGLPEVYVVRSIWESPDGDEWARIRIPNKSKPTEGWVDREALGSFGISRSAIRINRQLRRLTAYKDGRPVLRTPVGIGKPETPTPAGDFWVRNKNNVDPKSSFKLFGRTIPNSVYGPKMITTSASSEAIKGWPGGGLIGIHGTNQPGLIPGRVSHGCVRLPNDKIRRVYKLASPGTPIKIL